jgi:hypothetical protein
MTLHEQQAALDALDADKDAIQAFVADLDTGRLQVINDLVYQELLLRYQGKPLDKSRLH